MLRRGTRESVRVPHDCHAVSNAVQRGGRARASSRTRSASFRPCWSGMSAQVSGSSATRWVAPAGIWRSLPAPISLPEPDTRPRDGGTAIAVCIAVMNWVLANSPTSGNERLVLLALADACSRDDGTGCLLAVGGHDRAEGEHKLVVSPPGDRRAGSRRACCRAGRRSPVPLVRARPPACSASTPTHQGPVRAASRPSGRDHGDHVHTSVARNR